MWFVRRGKRKKKTKSQLRNEKDVWVMALIASALNSAYYVRDFGQVT